MVMRARVRLKKRLDSEGKKRELSEPNPKRNYYYDKNGLTKNLTTNKGRRQESNLHMAPVKGDLLYLLATPA